MQRSDPAPRAARRVPPILVALAAQLAAGALLWFVLSSGSGHTLPSIGPLRLALLQGALASLASFALGQRAWWLAIQFGFWLAVVAAQTLKLSASVYLGAFVVALLFFWTTFRTQVPLFLSGPAVWQSLESLVPKRAAFRFADLGCGLGGVLDYLSRVRPNGNYLGVEVAPLPWLIAWWRSLFSGCRYRVLRRDYRRLDLSEFDVVFCFLSPAVMPNVWQQARRQMRKGSLFVSCEFDVPGQPPSFEVESNGRGSRLLYVWRMP